MKACIRVSGGLSNFFNCNVGTRQGCLTSPLIFCLFINDLVDYMKAKFPNGVFINDNICDLYALMYADDISSMSETAIQLQRQINCISQYCKEVSMQINIDKTKIIVFRNNGHLKEHEKWYFEGKIIEVVLLYKYLGVYMIPKLSWGKTH